MTRGRTVALILSAVALVLVSSLLVWVTGRAEDVAGATASTATGSQVATGLVPLALAAGAGGFAFTLTDGRSRVLVALIVLATGLGVLASAVGVLAAPPGVTQDGTTTRLTAATVSPAGPALAIVGALGIAGGGLTALLRGGRWTRRPARQATGPRDEPRVSEWDRLSRGEDPT